MVGGEPAQRQFSTNNHRTGIRALATSHSPDDMLPSFIQFDTRHAGHALELCAGSRPLLALKLVALQAPHTATTMYEERERILSVQSLDINLHRGKRGTRALTDPAPQPATWNVGQLIVI